MHLFSDRRRGPKGIHPRSSELASLPLWTVMACAIGVLLWNVRFYRADSELQAAGHPDAVASLDGAGDPSSGAEAHGRGLGVHLAGSARSDARMEETGSGASAGEKAAGDPGEVWQGDQGLESQGAEHGESQDRVRHVDPLRFVRGWERDGRRTGLWETTYEDGQPRSSGNYEDDVREGRWRYWARSGQLELSGDYRGGRRDGAWRGWHPNGSRRSQQAYDLGLRTGAWTLWYSNGQIKESGLYARGLRQGPWQFYDFQGNPDLRTGTYLNGQRTTDGE